MGFDFLCDALGVGDVDRVFFVAHPDAVEEIRDLVVELEQEALLASPPSQLHFDREALEGHLVDQDAHTLWRICGQRRPGVLQDVMEEEGDRAVLAQFVRKGRLGEKRHCAPDRMDGVGGLAIPAPCRLAHGSSMIPMEDEDLADDVAEILHQLSTPRARSSRRGSARRRKRPSLSGRSRTARPGRTVPRPRGA